jgi:hypothetical protein
VARSGNGLKNFQSGRVGQGFRYFLDLRSVHGPVHSVSKLLPGGQRAPGRGGTRMKKMQPIVSIVI